jgi:hypothetical protein
MTAPLSHRRDFAIVIATRTASGLSVIGSAIIISTFVYFPFFRKRTLSCSYLLQKLMSLSDQSSSILRDVWEHLDEHCDFDVKRSFTERLRAPV